MARLPQLFLPLRIGADADGPPAKKKKRATLVAGLPVDPYAEAARRVMTRPAEGAPHEIWARPANPVEANQNAQLQQSFATAPQTAVPSVDDLIQVAQSVGTTVLATEEQQGAFLDAALSPPARAYVSGIAARSAPDDLTATRVDFYLHPQWRAAFAPALQNVPSFQAYRQLNEAVQLRFDRIFAETPSLRDPATSLEHLLVVLPGAGAQVAHTDGDDDGAAASVMCTVALNLRQDTPAAGSTAFPVRTSGTNTNPNILQTTGAGTGGVAAQLNQGIGPVHQVNNATGYVSAWSGEALHRGTGNASQAPRVFLYTEWGFKHNF